MENELKPASEEESFDMNDLMTPEEFEQFKALEAKIKKQKKMAGQMKGKVFEDLTAKFGSTMSSLVKQQITISTKDAYSDGQIYSITFGVEQDEQPDIDTKELTTNIIDEFLSKVEPIMGVAKSLNLTGTYEGDKLFWQIRKRDA